MSFLPCKALPVLINRLRQAEAVATDATRRNLQRDFEVLACPGVACIILKQQGLLCLPAPYHSAGDVVDRTEKFNSKRAFHDISMPCLIFVLQC